MFLKLHGVTGEAADVEHQGEIDVVRWSWGMQAAASAMAGQPARSTIGELELVKHVDQSSPTLMGFLRGNRVIAQGLLTVRKAGQTPLPYFLIEMEKVRVTSIREMSEEASLLEHVTFGFAKVKVSYIPQGGAGGRGGGANVFEADTHAGV